MREYYILWDDSHTHGNHVSQGLPGTEIYSSGSAGLQLATDHVCIISFNLSKKQKKKENYPDAQTSDHLSVTTHFIAEKRLGD